MNKLTKNTNPRTETTTRLGGLCLALLLILPFFPVTPALAEAEADAAGKRLRIAYSNDILGEIAACGSCNPAYRKGGLAKKMTSLKALRAGDAPLVILDAGNQFFKFPGAPETEAEARAARIRAEGLAAAHKRMGLAACGIGVNDLAAGPDFLLNLHEAPPLLSANLVDDKSGRRLFPASLVARAGELTVGIVALTGTHGVEQEEASWSVRPWRDALPEVLAELEAGEAKPDLLILLSNNPLTENRKIAETFPQLDLIFQSGFAMGNLPSIGATNALISQTDIRGRYLGLLDMERRGRGPWQERKDEAKGAEPAESADAAGATRTGQAQAGKQAGRSGASAPSTYSQRFIVLNAEVADDPEMERFAREVERKSRVAK